MGRKGINVNDERRLYIESMGRCMNPDCKEELLMKKGDIIEKAHIIPYYETQDNSFDNLIILCPNCHTNFDKNKAFNIETIRKWKQIRKEELKNFFSVKFNSFDELKKRVVPILSQNYNIYVNYYLNNNKTLWDKFELKILSNNEKLKLLFENNINLFQDSPDKSYSNLEIIQKFITHIDEFKYTRYDEEKNRTVLFPEEINSIFGIRPVSDGIIPSTESLEELIKIFREKKLLNQIILGEDRPYILLENNDKIFLDDAPQLRQLYFEYNCFRKTGVRLESLNFALKYLKSREKDFVFDDLNSVRKIKINNIKITFVYEYCLSKAFLCNMSPIPKPNDIIVNLHNWNGESCISKEAFDLAKTFGVTLLTMETFYKYVNKIK